VGFVCLVWVEMRGGGRLRAAGTTPTGRRRLRRAVDPIFVDRTGRRRRLAGLGGAVAALVLVSAAVIMLAGFTGASGSHLPGLPGLGGAQAPGVAPAAGQSAVPHPGDTTRPASPGPVRSSGPSTGAGNALPTIPLPSVTTHRTVPTQTPTHPGKKS
jgi:hypothetical protein